MPRSRLGPLAIESKLGDNPSQSSMWHAIHVKQKRSIAVKIFSAPFGGTPEARAAFAAEWETLKGLDHPALVRCYGGGFEDADAYLAFELIQGETLAAQLQRKSRLSWEAVLDLAEPLAAGLEYLHSHNILHGAIQPDKIMMAGLSPVLCDLRVDRAGTSYKTTTPITAMEVGLQPPELSPADATFTRQSDLYSLGATLYWALTGDPPISGSTVEEIRGNVEFQEPIAPATVVLECPVWLDKVVMQLLSKNPTARPPSASAVKLALAEVRRRAMSRTGVAEHVTSGFSPLKMANQQESDEARTLLGRELVDLDKQDKKKKKAVASALPWHDQAWVLIGVMVLMLAMLAWVAWPASEAKLRAKAESLIAQDTRSAMSEAKRNPLREILTRFPDSKSAEWAHDRIDEIDVHLFLHQLSVKIKNNLAIKRQDELLHKQAQEFVEIDDTRQALEMYRSIITVLGDDPEYKTAVNAARSQIQTLQNSTVDESEAAKIVKKQLSEADALVRQGQVAEAREIWTSLVKLYGGKSSLSLLIQRAEQRFCLLYTSPSPRDQRGSRMPSSA